jgi:hypothetical protein
MLNKVKPTMRLCDACRPPQDYIMKRDGITQSMCGNFLSCPLRGMLAINRWTRPDKAMNTRFGSLFHDTLDKIYSNGITSIQKIEKMIDAYLAQHAKEWGSSADQKAEFDAALASALFEVYLEKWEDDFTKKKFTAVEQTVEADIIGYKLRAKIDGEYKSKTGSAWLMEHKTKSRIDEESLLLKITFDFQNLYYRLIWSTLHPKVKLAGTLYNIIRKPGHKMKGGETLKDFRNRLVTEIRKDKEYFFKRYELAYSPIDDKRFIIELERKLVWIEGFITGTLPWRNEFACEQPYRCEFLEACSSNNMTGYIQRPKLFMELDT